MILKKLKDYIRQKHWDAFVLPQCDIFLNPASFIAKNRMTQLAHFTGSTSTLIITPGQIYLCVDARYILQARQEKAAYITIFPGTLTQWIKQFTPTLIAMNPWLLSTHQARLLEKLVPSIQWDYSFSYFIDLEIFSSLQNKKDSALFPEQELPLHEITSIDYLKSLETFLPRNPIYAIEWDQSFQEKCARVFPKKLERPALLTKGEDMAWLANLRGSDVDFTPFFQAFMRIEENHGSFSGQIFTALPRSFALSDPAISFHPLSHVVHENHFSCDPMHTPYALNSGREERFSLAISRACKSLWETQQMKQAHIQDGVAVVKFLHWLSTIPLDGSYTEWSVIPHLESFRQQSAVYQGPSFPPISAFGTHSAMIHYRALPEKAAPLLEGLYLIDSGGQYRFGTTDITRTLWLGTSPSYQQKFFFTCVLQAHIQLASLIFPQGTCGRALDAIARSFLWQQDLDYDHATGHGVGVFLNVHESPPIISQRAPDLPIEEGMIFSNEPGYYKENMGGIRLENVVLARTYTDCAKEPLGIPRLCLETISLAPFDRQLILNEELSCIQKTWLNAYHENVYGVLAPFLEEPVTQWLYDQTRPI